MKHACALCACCSRRGGKEDHKHRYEEDSRALNTGKKGVRAKHYWAWKNEVMKWTTESISKLSRALKHFKISRSILHTEAEMQTKPEKLVRALLGDSKVGKEEEEESMERQVLSRLGDFLQKWPTDKGKTLRTQDRRTHSKESCWKWLRDECKWKDYKFGGRSSLKR